MEFTFLMYDWSIGEFGLGIWTVNGEADEGDMTFHSITIGLAFVGLEFAFYKVKN